MNILKNKKGIFTKKLFTEIRNHISVKSFPYSEPNFSRGARVDCINYCWIYRDDFEQDPDSIEDIFLDHFYVDSPISIIILMEMRSHFYGNTSLIKYYDPHGLECLVHILDSSVLRIVKRR